MARFNTKRKTSKTTNLAGGAAYKMGAEEELVHGVLTTFLDDKYYESSEERIDRLTQLIERASPEFVANLAVIARKEFHLRSVSHLLLGALAVRHNGDDLIKRAVVASAERPDDLTEFASYVIDKLGHLTKQAKRGIRNALLKFDRYALAKYRMENKDISLVDLFNLTHPKAMHATEEQRQAWADLMSGTLRSFDTWETEISSSTDENRTEKWESLVLDEKIGYMALLRNLNNLVKAGVSRETIKKAASLISDRGRVLHSKQLPFRFVKAFEQVHGNRLLSDAISEALDIAVENVPEFDGKTLVAVDTSGSMSGEPIEHASIFAASIARKNPGVDVVLYDTRVEEFSVSGRTPVVDIAKRIKSSALGGGTATSAVFNYACEHNKRYDRVVIISDNQSWSDGSVTDAYNHYRQECGCDPVVVAIDIAGYGTKDVLGGKVFHVVGWSERVFDFIKAIGDKSSLVKYVREYKLD